MTATAEIPNGLRMGAKPVRDYRRRPSRRAGVDESLVNGQTGISTSPLRGLEGMAEGVRVSSTVDFDQPRKEGKPHGLRMHETRFTVVSMA